MTEAEIKHTKKNIIIPLTLYVVLCFAAILYYWFISEKRSAQIVSLFIAAYSFVFTIFYAVKLNTFNKTLKSSNI